MNFEIIVSVGDALISSPEKLKKIDSFGECIYRINGAHIDVEGIPLFVQEMRRTLRNPKIMLDLPGNKIRTKGISDPIRLNKGEVFELYTHLINYPEFNAHVNIGDVIYTNDSTLALEVKEVGRSVIRLVPHHDGLLQNNKGLHVRGMDCAVPFILQKDIDLINTACELDIDYIALSFVRTANDIKEAKKIIESRRNKSINIIAKVETAQALDNLGYIFKEVDRINIDRGDLSAEIGILKLPAIQERLIDSAKRAGKKVYLATQFLKNMENNPVPLISEIVDLFNTIKSGVSGIQLSEETAIGKYSVECVKLVFDLYNRSFSG